jgi:ligand-binding SRPBCC domain-containing protein
MRCYRLTREQWIPKPLDEAFAFFARPENLEEITPPFLKFHIVQADRELHAGSLIHYRLRVHGLPMRWTSEITVWDPPQRFVDVQVKGPYALWRHQHEFAADGDGTRISDDVQYALPFGFVGQMAHAIMVRRDVEGIFEFRRKKLEELMGK